MLALDFINIGNGDSILIREMENGEQKFSMMVDFGHDNLIRDDHPDELDPRSTRIYAGDFLKKLDVTHLDVAIATHYHRDHIGGLNRVLQAVTVGEFLATYFPPENSGELQPDNNDLPKAGKNLIRCVNMYAQAFYQNPGKVEKFTLLPGNKMETIQLTPDLKMELMFGEPSLYPRQKEVYDAIFNGERNAYDLLHWAKALNVSSIRARLYYHGKEIVLGGDAYAHVWETVSLKPCDILKVPHHATLDSTTRKMIQSLQPKQAVVCVAARRPDERPHPYIVSLLKEYIPEVYFTDAVEIPGMVEPEFHESVHLEVE